MILVAVQVLYLQFNVPDKPRVARVSKKDITEANDWVSSKGKRFGHSIIYNIATFKFNNLCLIMLFVLYLIC